ncbi:MAG: ribonuclease J [bacterium]|nr:ribonuclease J [bacterium]
MPTHKKKPSIIKNKGLSLIPLGGFHEIGKNMLVVEYDDEILIIDGGMSFPSIDMPGVDVVIPKFDYILENRHRVSGIVLTHGHEDHIGALPYLLRQAQFPVYGTKLSLAFLEIKLREHSLLMDSKLFEVEDDGVYKIGDHFEVCFVPVCHSIPDACGLAIRTPEGVIIHSGDFKFDQTPVDNRKMNLGAFARYGDEGVLAFITDVTNVMNPGYTGSERRVGVAFKELFKDLTGRIFVTTFASHLHRIEQAIDVAVELDRKVVMLGRRMVDYINVSRNLGYLDVSDDIFVNEENINDYEDSDLLFLATGTQGEPGSALRLMAENSHQVQIREGDSVVLSASPIPGNEAHILRIINQLTALGADVYGPSHGVHVSGHASREEIKLLYNLVKPKFVLPFHGEIRHMRDFANLMKKMGHPKDNVVLGKIGQRIHITENKIKIVEKITSGVTMVDGLGVGDLDGAILNERKALASSGILVVTVFVSEKTKKVERVELEARGVLYFSQHKELLEKSEIILRDSLRAVKESDYIEYPKLKEKAEDKMRKLFWKYLRRDPYILTNVYEI